MVTTTNMEQNHSDPQEKIGQVRKWLDPILSREMWRVGKLEAKKSGREEEAIV